MYHRDNPEADEVAMIFPAMNDLKNAIGKKDSVAFKKGFIVLTKSCNSCHEATDYSFNVIIVPSIQSFPNHEFNKIK